MCAGAKKVVKVKKVVKPKAEGDKKVTPKAKKTSKPKSDKPKSVKPKKGGLNVPLALYCCHGLPQVLPFLPYMCWLPPYAASPVSCFCAAFPAMCRLQPCGACCKMNGLCIFLQRKRQ